MQFGPVIPFVKLLGFELRQFGDGASEMVFQPAAEHLNSFDVVHGGAILTLMDVTMAVAARSVQRDMGVITIELKTSFMQPAIGLLTAKGQLLHRTGSMAFTQASVWDAQGALCAHATGTFKYAARRPAATGAGDPSNGIATD